MPLKSEIKESEIINLEPSLSHKNPSIPVVIALKRDLRTTTPFLDNEIMNQAPVMFSKVQFENSSSPLLSAIMIRDIATLEICLNEQFLNEMEDNELTDMNPVEELSLNSRNTQLVKLRVDVG